MFHRWEQEEKGCLQRTETILSLVNNIGWWKTMKRWNYIYRTPGNIF